MSDHEGRHATNLELFLDLVFVFAVTQIAALVTEDLTAAGVARGLLIALLVWWQWSQYTWAGSATDLQARAANRLLVLATIPGTLLMTISIPGAYHDTGLWFGWSYCVVQVLVLFMQGSLALMSPDTRLGFLRYGSLAMITPIIVVVGAYVHGDARVAVWVLAIAFNVAGAFAGAGSSWAIDATHFAERHGLFVIIALGEVLVGAGGTAYAASVEHGIDRDVMIAIVVSAAVAGTLWWTYFAYVPEVGERLLRDAEPTRRGVLARDVYTLLHFPLVFGLILFAVVVEHLVEHPTEALGTDDRWLLFLAVACYIGALMLVRVRLARRLSPERLALIAAVGVLCVVGRDLRGTLLVAIAGVLIGAAHAVRHRLYRREVAGAANG